MKHSFCILLVAAALAVAMSACSGGIVYDKYRPTPIEGWEKNDTVVFNVPKLAASGRYREEVGLRINGAYPFTGLSLLVEQVIEPGNKKRADTLDCRLYDSKGNILGSGINSFQYVFILSDVDMEEGDSLHVVVSHIMKREILPGISDVGFRLSRK